MDWGWEGVMVLCFVDFKLCKFEKLVTVSPPTFYTNLCGMMDVSLSDSQPTAVTIH